jgi:hypothetical protein
MENTLPIVIMAGICGGLASFAIRREMLSKAILFFVSI